MNVTGFLFGTKHFLGAASQGHGQCCTLRGIKTLLFFTPKLQTTYIQPLLVLEPKVQLLCAEGCDTFLA